MKKIQRLITRIGLTLLAGVLIGGGVLGSGKMTPQASAAAAGNGYVFYNSEDVLYRVPTTGGTPQKIAEKFEGSYADATSKYLYFFDNNDSTKLQRVSLTEPDALISSFAGNKNIIFYEIVGDFIYFMDDKGVIYRSLANAADDSQIKQIANNADTEFPGFSVKNGRIYYNVLKNGTNTWAASKSRDGSGNVQFIAQGAIPASTFIRSGPSGISVMVDTKPAETYYSYNAMVLYTLPLNGGNPKAANAKNPLDVNATMSGSWSNDYYVYNKGVTVDDDDNYVYSKSKGYAMTKNGVSFQLSQNGVVSLADMGGNKLAYVGSNGKGYISTIANNKVTSTKPVALSNVTDVYNVNNGTAAGQIVFYATGGVYAVNTDLSVTKLNGVTWDNSAIYNNIDGIYYFNEEDNKCLYKMSADGKTKLKLSDGPVTEIYTIINN
ncbi:DUF5050 domain-containing protein [Paenibacillus jilunlii]|uniref:Prolow-density lipoprotein receptor-related protein 1-like beta-propeller domain-containing protein n=1 Tax=Paenibacillus jilunlii TaxID=682956 RepID=A0A1G9H9A2_9BACL|nr:DUF5050 domain-containing protein [Paenibacillus jilunlii]KWX77446.1 hypothetical protein AML91_07840 [Paenibacillus jilunlii]SDL09489.1 protein of unknown function [Paenibacillus jilunlii]